MQKCFIYHHRLAITLLLFVNKPDSCHEPPVTAAYGRIGRWAPPPAGLPRSSARRRYGNVLTSMAVPAAAGAACAERVTAGGAPCRAAVTAGRPHTTVPRSGRRNSAVNIRRWPSKVYLGTRERTATEYRGAGGSAATSAVDTCYISRRAFAGHFGLWPLINTALKFDQFVGVGGRADNKGHFAPNGISLPAAHMHSDIHTTLFKSGFHNATLHGSPE